MADRGLSQRTVPQAVRFGPAPPVGKGGRGSRILGAPLDDEQVPLGSTKQGIVVDKYRGPATDMKARRGMLHGEQDRTDIRWTENGVTLTGGQELGPKGRATVPRTGVPDNVVDYEPSGPRHVPQETRDAQYRAGSGITRHDQVERGPLQRRAQDAVVKHPIPSVAVDRSALKTGPRAETTKGSAAATRSGCRRCTAWRTPRRASRWPPAVATV
jgi:hypothetical protein